MTTTTLNPEEKKARYDAYVAQWTLDRDKAVAKRAQPLPAPVPKQVPRLGGRYQYGHSDPYLRPDVPYDHLEPSTAHAAWLRDQEEAVS